MVGALVVPIMVVTVVVVPTVVVPIVVTPLLERRVDEPKPARNANTMAITTTMATVWFLVSFIPPSVGFTPTHENSLRTAAHGITLLSEPSF
jgi:MFS-type transporter involved in bile tolerance (Atg22 family)